MNAGSVNRPGWIEVVAVLAGCAILLVVLARMDERASRAHATRAAEAILKRESVSPPDRVHRRVLGERPAARADLRPAVIPGRARGLGLSIAAQTADADAPAAIRRIEGPSLGASP